MICPPNSKTIPVQIMYVSGNPRLEVPFVPVVSPGCQGIEFLINQISVILHVINVIQDVITAICIVAISMSKEGIIQT